VREVVPLNLHGAGGLIKFVGKRRRAAAVQNAGANASGARTARSVLECASPLALWAGRRAGRAEVKRRRDARGDAKLFHLFDDGRLDWLATC
jgi:hypothetical protein